MDVDNIVRYSYQGRLLGSQFALSPKRARIGSGYRSEYSNAISHYSCSIFSILMLFSSRCEAMDSAPGQGGDEESGQWCVARPSVPFETLQEAMDYACGEGGADCEQIRSDGSCYFPDNVFSHSSFAFNSYW
ncbi:hypothetical protein Sjap_025812 [Stephania japonica]|uniref:X8 domain-containing protein n=1 Tax=Stephania japonica TaxID=461633 RepID=A0AAP0E2G7_9MAGN